MANLRMVIWPLMPFILALAFRSGRLGIAHSNMERVELRERVEIPKLVRCPGAADSAKGGALRWAGGGVELKGRGHALQIPRGAVRGVLNDTDFRMKRIAGDYLNLQVEAENATGKYQFRHPVRLTMSWAGCGWTPSPEDVVEVYKIDPSSLLPIGEPLPEVSDRRTSHSITVLLDSLSNYALATAN